jgi:hypothetical protein
MAKQTFTTGQVLTAANMTSLQATALGGGAATAKTASYVLVAADAGTTVIMNSASATTITVNTSLFSAGDTVFIQNIGVGVSTITPGTATVNTASSLALAQYESGNLYFTAAGVSIFSKADGAGAGASALTLISTASPSAASSVSINSCFSATYENYLIMYNYTATNNSGVQLRMRASGADDSTSTYFWNGFYQWQQSPSALTVEGGGATVTEWWLAYQDTQGINTGMVYLYNPFSATNTLYDASTFSNRSTPQFVGRQNYGGRTNNNTSYDGFSIVMNTPTITGKVRVYGIGI